MKSSNRGLILKGCSIKNVPGRENFNLAKEEGVMFLHKQGTGLLADRAGSMIDCVKTSGMSPGTTIQQQWGGAGQKWGRRQVGGGVPHNEPAVRPTGQDDLAAAANAKWPSGIDGVRICGWCGWGG